MNKLSKSGLAASGAFVASPLGAGLMIGSVVLIVCTVAFKCLKKKSSGDKESEETPVREAINPENRVLEEEQKKEPPSQNLEEEVKKERDYTTEFEEVFLKEDVVIEKNSQKSKKSEEMPVRKAFNPENRALQEEQKEEPPSQNSKDECIQNLESEFENVFFAKKAEIEKIRQELEGLEKLEEIKIELWVVEELVEKLIADKEEKKSLFQKLLQEEDDLISLKEESEEKIKKNLSLGLKEWSYGLNKNLEEVEKSLNKLKPELLEVTKFLFERKTHRQKVIEKWLSFLEEEQKVLESVNKLISKKEKRHSLENNIQSALFNFNQEKDDLIKLKKDTILLEMYRMDINSVDVDYFKPKKEGLEKKKQEETDGVDHRRKMLDMLLGNKSSEDDENILSLSLTEKPPVCRSSNSVLAKIECNLTDENIENIISSYRLNKVYDKKLNSLIENNLEKNKHLIEEAVVNSKQKNAEQVFLFQDNSEEEKIKQQIILEAIREYYRSNRNVKSVLLLRPRYDSNGSKLWFQSQNIHLIEGGPKHPFEPLFFNGAFYHSENEKPIEGEKENFEKVQLLLQGNPVKDNHFGLSWKLVSE